MNSNHIRTVLQTTKQPKTSSLPTSLTAKVNYDLLLPGSSSNILTKQLLNEADVVVGKNCTILLHVSTQIDGQDHDLKGIVEGVVEAFKRNCQQLGIALIKAQSSSTKGSYIFTIHPEPTHLSPPAHLLLNPSLSCSLEKIDIKLCYSSENGIPRSRLPVKKNKKQKLDHPEEEMINSDDENKFSSNHKNENETLASRLTQQPSNKVVIPPYDLLKQLSCATLPSPLNGQLESLLSKLCQNLAIKFPLIFHAPLRNHLNSTNKYVNSFLSSSRSILARAQIKGSNGTKKSGGKAFNSIVATVEKEKQVRKDVLGIKFLDSDEEEKEIEVDEEPGFEETLSGVLLRMTKINFGKGRIKLIPKEDLDSPDEEELPSPPSFSIPAPPPAVAIDDPTDDPFKIPESQTSIPINTNITQQYFLRPPPPLPSSLPKSTSLPLEPFQYPLPEDHYPPMNDEVQDQDGEILDMDDVAYHHPGSSWRQRHSSNHSGLAPSSDSILPSCSSDFDNGDDDQEQLQIHEGGTLRAWGFEDWTTRGVGTSDDEILETCEPLRSNLEQAEYGRSIPGGVVEEKDEYEMEEIYRLQQLQYCLYPREEEDWFDEDDGFTGSPQPKDDDILMSD